MLNDIVFLPTYFKTRNELYSEFYKPCMENSIQYDRITGYFGSSVFLVINQALKEFVLSEGKIRIICSPNLKDEDLKAIIEGYKNKNHKNLGVYLNEVIDQLSLEYPNSTCLLAKLILSGILELKIAFFGDNSESYRLMHDKAGVFTDKEGNSVAFRGSINETFKGVSNYGNSESFDVFTTWEEKKDNSRVNLVRDQFEKMWSNTEPNIDTYDLPDISFEKIKEFQTDKDMNELIDESNYELFIKKPKWFAESGNNRRIVKKHQEQILNNWETRGRKGLFEMCTGSGKTFAALCAIREALYEKHEIPLIIVPSKLLFNQWYEELILVFNYDIAILRIGAGHTLDISKIKMYSNPKLDVKRCFLITYQMASKDVFIDNFNWGSNIFLICDEVHNIGSNQYIRLLEVDVGAKIGLSATPKRYFDEKATKKIFEYFNGVVEPKYTIADAIKDGVLCSYFYDIFEVQLTLEEQEKWNLLTNEINKKIAIHKNEENIIDIKGLELLLFQRADILKKAEKKIDVAEKILLENYEKDQRWLVYLDDTEHVKQLKNRLLKNEGFRGNVFEYHTNTDSDLEQTIKYFISSGAILLSINCLDEGVDIPSIDHAIILSSSKNPRQYIQRRGRVLRQFQNKNFAYIYDCLVFPNYLITEADKSLSILRGEIARSMNFAENAVNSKTIKNKLKIIMNKNDINELEGEYGINE